MPWLLTLPNGETYTAQTFTHTDRKRPILRLGHERPSEWIDATELTVEWVEP